MARVNNLSNFLTDVASAIKEKKGDNTNIPAANFDTEILSLPSQGVYQSKQMTINTNGNYEIIPDDGYDAIESLRLSIEAGEDLTDVLNTQDQKIAELEAALENKTAGSGNEPNIFVQENEPTIKKGIWLQTNKELEHIYGDDDVFIAGEWKPDGACKAIPYSFSGGSVVAIGTDVYLLGGNSSALSTYKYDTLADTYTKLSNIPYQFSYGSAVSVGTNIYLFGSSASNYSEYCYKYDTLTDTYTQLAKIPYSFNEGSAVAVGTNVYLFGSNNSSYYKYAYKYDTLTDTYSQLANIPYTFYGGSVVAIGTDVYLLGGNSSALSTYKYDTLADTYTKLSNIPYQFSYGSAVSVGTNIYLFGGSASNSSKYCYKYDILTDTYTQLANIPYAFSSSTGACAVLIDVNIYLLGGSKPTKIQVYSVESSSYENNSVVIAQGRYYQSGYGVELYNDDLFSSPMLYAFADAWFYTTEDGIITDIPTYYGNGTEWVKFKN